MSFSPAPAGVTFVLNKEYNYGCTCRKNGFKPEYEQEQVER